jgi:DNA-binding response OmpR family regulator
MEDKSSRPKTAVIIEDDVDMRSLLDEVFSAAGFHTVLVGSGLDGVAAVAEHKPVITTLDVNLPGIDGFEVARRVRKISSTFIIMLSALAEESDVVLGLSSGADEYLVKPFRPRELRARIEALMRRPVIENQPQTTIVVGTPEGIQPARTPARNPTGTAAIPIIDHGSADQWSGHRDLSLDLATHTVLVAQKEVDLTPTEFDLLATLLESKRRVRSKSDLAMVLRGEAFGASSYYVGEPDKRAIEAHMANLRRKIGDNPTDPRYIETVRGVGSRPPPGDQGAA